MTNSTEWRTGFDILFNNIMSNQAPGLNDYEVSVILTQAQEELVITLYSGRRLNSFESTEEVKQYLSPLVEQVTLITPDSVLPVKTLGSDSYVFSLPSNLWFKTLERVIVRDDSLKCKGNDQREMSVIPVTQDEYDRTINNPFKTNNDRRVLVLTPALRKSELISKYPISKYIVRYIRKPRPIILTDLSSYGLSINGETAEHMCELHEALHETILQRAVEIARGIWMNTVQNQQ